MVRWGQFRGEEGKEGGREGEKKEARKGQGAGGAGGDRGVLECKLEKRGVLGRGNTLCRPRGDHRGDDQCASKSF